MLGTLTLAAGSAVTGWLLQHAYQSLRASCTRVISASGFSTFVRFTLVSAFCKIEIFPIAIPENTDLPSNTLITPILLIKDYGITV